MTSDWFFVIGISCEISGAVLLASELVLVRASDIAMRNITYPTSGEPIPKHQEGAAQATVGAALIAAGFFLQLLGYVIESSEWWFIAVAAAVTTATFLGGRRVALRVLVPFRQRRAEMEFAKSRARKG